MPIYEYICDDCGREFEVLIRGTEQPVCPSCGQSRLTKQLSVPAAHVAASGEPSCPARDSCGVKHCCGGNCGMGEMM